MEEASLFGNIVQEEDPTTAEVEEPLPALSGLASAAVRHSPPDEGNAGRAGSFSSFLEGGKASVSRPNHLPACAQEEDTPVDEEAPTTVNGQEAAGASNRALKPRGPRGSSSVVDGSEAAPVPWPVTSSRSSSGVDYSMTMRLGLPCSSREAVLLVEYAIRPKLEEDEEAREKRWREACHGVPLMAAAAPSTVESLRQLARRPQQGGIPRSLRGVMWPTLTGMAQKLEENEHYCAWLLRRSGYVTGHYGRAIAVDLERTFPGHPYFSSKDVGLYKLRNVLHALCWRNPLLNYCQSFNYMAGFLLLVFDDEERTFWLLTHLLETLLPNDYFSETLLGTCVDQAVFEVLVAAKMPRLANHVSEMNHFDISAVLPQWVMSLYVSTLPPETTLRVWDYMLTESAVASERTSAHLEVALAILKLSETALLRCEDAGDVMELLRDVTETLFDADQLIATARSLSIDPTELHLLRRQRKTAVALEVQQRKERREARQEQTAVQAELLLLRQRQRECPGQQSNDRERQGQL